MEFQKPQSPSSRSPVQLSLQGIENLTNHYQKVVANPPEHEQFCIEMRTMNELRCRSLIFERHDLHHTEKFKKLQSVMLQVEHLFLKHALKTNHSEKKKKKDSLKNLLLAAKHVEAQSNKQKQQPKPSRKRKRNEVPLIRTKEDYNLRPKRKRKKLR